MNRDKRGWLFIMTLHVFLFIITHTFFVLSLTFFSIFHANESNLLSVFSSSLSLHRSLFSVRVLSSPLINFNPDFSCSLFRQLNLGHILCKRVNIFEMPYHSRHGHFCLTSDDEPSQKAFHINRIGC
jgi:hypothetical protein